MHALVSPAGGTSKLAGACDGPLPRLVHEKQLGNRERGRPCASVGAGFTPPAGGVNPSPTTGLCRACHTTVTNRSRNRQDFSITLQSGAMRFAEPIGGRTDGRNDTDTDPGHWDTRSYAGAGRKAGCVIGKSARGTTHVGTQQ